MTALSLTLMLDGVGWSVPCTGHFSHKNILVPVVLEPGWAQCQSGWEQKISLPLGFDHWTVSPKQVAALTELSRPTTVTDQLLMS